MRNTILSALLVVSGVVSSLVSVANAKDVTGNKTLEATKKRETWAMLRSGDVRVMAFLDRDTVVADGGATVVLTGQPSENVKEIILDVELLYAKDKSDTRRVVRVKREKVAMDANTHSVTLPIGERSLDGYSILVRVADTSSSPDNADSTIKVADHLSHGVVLALGKR